MNGDLETKLKPKGSNEQPQGNKQPSQKVAKLNSEKKYKWPIDVF